MANLNWKSAPVKLETVPHPFRQKQLKLGIAEGEKKILKEALDALLSGSTAEVRLDLPEGWTIYWKIRDGETRFLLAHPEHSEWVGTFAFEKSHLQKVASQLAALSDESVLDLSEGGSVSRLSNLDILILMKG